MKEFLCAIFTVFCSDAVGLDMFPKKDITYGSRCTQNSPEFRELRYKEKIAICHRKVSTGTKKRVYASYNIDYSNRGNYTVDHYIPLFVGGSNNINNLWPQPRIITSSALEQKLYIMLYQDRINTKEVIWFIKERKDKK